MHYTRWLGLWCFKRCIIADNCADGGVDGRARGYSGNEDAEDGNREETDAKEGAVGNDDVDDDDGGGKCNGAFVTADRCAFVPAVKRRSQFGKLSSFCLGKRRHLRYG